MGIVVGFIRGAEGRAALDRAIEEARLRGGRLYVVHSSLGGDHETAEEVLADRDEFERVEAELTAAGIDHEVREMVLGNTPAQDVIGVAEETGSEMIVIGMRRRSRVGKLLLGSNAQDILLAADCAVLAVKPA